MLKCYLHHVLRYCFLLRFFLRYCTPAAWLRYCTPAAWLRYCTQTAWLRYCTPTAWLRYCTPTAWLRYCTPTAWLRYCTPTAWYSAIHLNVGNVIWSFSSNHHTLLTQVRYNNKTSFGYILRQKSNTINPHLSAHLRSQATVLIREYPDKWVTFPIYNYDLFPNMCPDKWIIRISGFRISVLYYMYYTIVVQDFTVFNFLILNYLGSWHSHIKFSWYMNSSHLSIMTVQCLYRFIVQVQTNTRLKKKIMNVNLFTHIYSVQSRG